MASNVGLTQFAVLAIVAAPGVSHADPPTHEVRLASVEDYPARGGELNSCVARAVLKNLGASSPAEIEVQLWFTHPRTGDPSALSYHFRKIGKGLTSDPITDHAAGASCRELKVSDIVVLCPDEPDGRCRSYNVKVQGQPVLELKTQVVSGR
jgi:hypothetical protein